MLTCRTSVGSTVGSAAQLKQQCAAQYNNRAYGGEVQGRSRIQKIVFIESLSVSRIKDYELGIIGNFLGRGSLFQGAHDHARVRRPSLVGEDGCR
ncbi:hypothetical protein [Methylobacterium sp. J-070]|uniref:hypothetical protein n=1 Tax=Methylobacterium sp. J-070 TaxID=2836650 RepID=UPI001FBA0AC6|nr:hypothetical protein [Methylobacterium sp. J-070]MCJ2054111.1 hypothetical protein [Methylobacterium sp. J-070]